MRLSASWVFLESSGVDWPTDWLTHSGPSERRVSSTGLTLMLSRGMNCALPILLVCMYDRHSRHSALVSTTIASINWSQRGPMTITAKTHTHTTNKTIQAHNEGGGKNAIHDTAWYEKHFVHVQQKTGSQGCWLRSINRCMEEKDLEILRSTLSWKEQRTDTKSKKKKKSPHHVHTYDNLCCAQHDWFIWFICSTCLSATSTWSLMFTPPCLLPSDVQQPYAFVCYESKSWW